MMASTAMISSMRRRMMMVVVVGVMVMVMLVAEAKNTNNVYSPCDDAKIQKKDGFTFGIVISSRESFFFNDTQLSPCDSRLSLSNASNRPQLSLFRPRVDEISLLTINSSSSFASQGGQGGYMVAFAGRKYAARSTPTFVANSSYTITSFTLVLEFQKGTLHNLFWKKNGCDSCSSSSVCLNKEDCAIKTSDCKIQGGSLDCGPAIQLAFSGTDRHEAVLNSWYEVSKLRQDSLLSLFSNLGGSLTSGL